MFATTWTPEQWILIISTVGGQAAVLVKLFRNDTRTVAVATNLATQVQNTSDVLASKVQATSDVLADKVQSTSATLANKVQTTTQDANNKQNEIASSVNGKLSERLDRMETSITTLGHLLEQHVIEVRDTLSGRALDNMKLAVADLSSKDQVAVVQAGVDVIKDKMPGNNG